MRREKTIPMEARAMQIVWRDEYALGDDIIDSGHRLVIEAVNHLNKAECPEQGEAVADHWLPILREFLTRQFEHESMLMTMYGLPESAQHEGEHRRLLNLLSVLHDCRQRGGEVACILLLNLVCFLAVHLRGSNGDMFRGSHRQAA